MNPQELINQIAVNLPTFTRAYEPQGFTPYLERSDGAMIFLRVGATRVRVSGQYAKHKNRYYGPRSSEQPVITCARSRGGEAIARDISKRFLPKYLPLYVESVAKAAETVVYEETTERSLQDVAEVVGTSLYHSTMNNHDVSVSYHAPNGAWMEVTASAEKVYMNLRTLTVDQAKQIAAIVAGKDA